MIIIFLCLSSVKNYEGSFCFYCHYYITRNCYFVLWISWDSVQVC